MSEVGVPGSRADLLRSSVATLLDRARRARDDFPTFYELVWYTPQGTAVELQPFHRRWLRAIESHPRVLVRAPRSHGKSELMSAYTLWELGREPRLRFKIGCQSDKRARSTLGSLKHHVTKNELYHLVFPDVKRDPEGVWTNTQIAVVRAGATRDPSIDALGVMSTVVGGRADRVWLDDPMDYRTAILQPQTRDAINAKVFAEWLPTLEPDGRVRVTMTPWSKSDIGAKIMAQPGWRTIETPVGTDEDPYAPIWPSRWSRAKLMELREAYGPIDYDRAYRLKVLSDDVAPVRPMWIKYYTAADLGNPDDLICVVSFDVAISQAASADYFACCVLLYDARRNLTFVADAWRGHYTFMEQAELVIQTAREWNADRVVIERVNYEGALAEYVEAHAGVPIPVVTVRPRTQKQRRVIEITPGLEKAHILFHPKLNPKHNQVELLQRGDLVSELLGFPYEAHDDLVDALTQGVQALREYGGVEDGATFGGGTIGVSMVSL